MNPATLMQPVADPYRAYAELRDIGLCFWQEGRMWLAPRYADARRLLEEPRLSHWTRCSPHESEPSALSAFDRLSHRWFRILHPDLRTSLRRRVSDRLGRAALDQDLLGDDPGVLGAAANSRRFDLIGDVAQPYTRGVAASLLGLQGEESETLQALLAGLDGTVLDAIDEPTAASRSLLDFLREAIRRRRARPRDDLLADLAEHAGASDHDGDLAMPFALFFLFAGYENMTNFLGNAVLALVRQPGAWAQLCATVDDHGPVVDELLRHDSPVQFVRLTAQGDVDAGGQTIRRGQDVLVCVGSANRDPDRFPDPDRLDFRRGDRHHLSFGSGALRCLGARLAHREAAVVLRSLARHFRHLTLTEGAIEWRAHPPVLRGPRAVPLEGEPRTP